MLIEADRCQLGANMEEVLGSDWIPDEVKVKIREFIPEWGVHMHIQTKVLKQLKSEQPLLRGHYPINNPRMLDEIRQWNRLEFAYADRLPALVPHSTVDMYGEMYEAQSWYLETNALDGPYVPQDWESTVHIFRFSWKRFRLASAHVNGRAEKEGKSYFKNPLIQCLGKKRETDEYGLATWKFYDLSDSSDDDDE